MSSAKPVSCALIGSALALLCEQASPAQTVPGADQDEIVVTAQRRPERPEDVPISLTVMSGDQLELMQATETAALEKVVPGLVMTRTSVFTQPFLRGVGKRSNLGVENSVATYVDGVYLASSIGTLLDLRGIDRIEVLNGPQGTLFGRNATGGVIQIITRDPSPDTSGEVMLNAGSYEYLRGDMYLTGGNDRIAANLAMSLSTNGGYGKNVFTGKSDEGEIEHSFVARSKWVWRPDGPLKLTLAADYQDIDQDFALQPVPGFPSPIGQPRVRSYYDGDHDTPNRFRFRYGGVSLRADGEIGDLTFMSLTAWRGMRARWSLDLDAGPQPLSFVRPNAEQKQFSHEFQLQSSKASPVIWVAGLYYIHIQEQYDPTVTLTSGPYAAFLGGRTRQTLFSSGNVSSYAAYGQGTLPVGSSTRLTLGLRYTLEDRSIRANAERLFNTQPSVRPIPNVPLLTQPPLRQRASFDELTWRASLDRHFSSELMGYLSASRGFQSGGWNLQTPQNPAFAPESLDDFEAGLKYADRSRRFSANASIFYYDYSDLQVSALTQIGQVTTNATSAELYGLELQIEAGLGQRTDVTFGTQLLKTRFKRFPNATCTNFSAVAAVAFASITCDVTGNHLPFAPELKFNVGASHRIPLGKMGGLVLSASLAHNDGYYAEPDNVVRQDSFTTVDASAEWRTSQRGLSIRLWALNLTDAQYSGALATVATNGVLQSPAAPRRFGASMAYRF